MLAQALNSSPHITCFREVFNKQLGRIQYGVEGYDYDNPQDLALRSRDPVGFLQERVYCRYPEEVRAVGFKFGYNHRFEFRHILERLIEDTQIRVLRVGRRNMLRMLVSLKIAERTGVWQQGGTPPPSLARRTMRSMRVSLWRAKPMLTPANGLKAFRHPRRAAARLRWLLRLPRAPRKTPRARLTVSEEELRTFIAETEFLIAHFDNLFQEHPRLTMFYEDMLDQRDEEFNRAQSFLGVEARPLTVTMRRQNPEPLRELLANYDELYEAFRDTSHAWMFQ
jgi:hypothetical protein